MKVRSIPELLDAAISTAVQRPALAAFVLAGNAILAALVPFVIDHWPYALTTSNSGEGTRAMVQTAAWFSKAVPVYLICSPLAMLAFSVPLLAVLRPSATIVSLLRTVAARAIVLVSTLATLSLLLGIAAFISFLLAGLPSGTLILANVVPFDKNNVAKLDFLLLVPVQVICPAVASVCAFVLVFTWCALLSDVDFLDRFFSGFSALFQRGFFWRGMFSALVFAFLGVVVPLLSLAIDFLLGKYLEPIRAHLVYVLVDTCAVTIALSFAAHAFVDSRLRLELAEAHAEPAAA